MENLFTEEEIDNALRDPDFSSDEYTFRDPKKNVTIIPVYFDSRQRRKVFEHAQDICDEIEGICFLWYSDPSIGLKELFEESPGEVKIGVGPRDVDEGIFEVYFKENGEWEREEVERDELSSDYLESLFEENMKTENPI